MPVKSDWSDDRIAKLKKLFEGGLPFSEIAAQIGGVSRNAVIGKARRLGLVRDEEKGPLSAVPLKRTAAPVRTTPFRPQVATQAPPPKKPARDNPALAPDFEVELDPEPLPYDDIVPMSQRVSLLGLSEANCHWPVGDPESPAFFFCGGKSLTGLPYCAFHSRIAYQPAQIRRRAPRPMPR